MKGYVIVTAQARFAEPLLVKRPPAGKNNDVLAITLHKKSVRVMAEASQTKSPLHRRGLFMSFIDQTYGRGAATVERLRRPELAAAMAGM